MPEETARNFKSCIEKDGLVGVDFGEEGVHQIIVPHGPNVAKIPRSFLQGSIGEAGARNRAMQDYLSQKLKEAIGKRPVTFEIKTKNPML